MAMIAACVLQPGVYFAVNSPGGNRGGDAGGGGGDHLGLGLSGDGGGHGGLAHDVGEQTLFNRTGGAPSLALGMAHIFARRRRAGGDRLLVSLRHHVRGAVHPDHHRRRHARGPLHAAGSAGARLPPLGRTSWMPGVIATSALMVAAWGYFLCRACAIRWAGSIRCGRCSASPTSCWRPSRSAWPPPSCSRCTARSTCGSPACRWPGWWR
jgi:carbon starvation protein